MAKPKHTSTETVRIRVPSRVQRVVGAARTPRHRAAASGPRPRLDGGLGCKELLENLYDALVIIDAEGGDVVEANERAETLFHWPRSALLRRSVDELISGADAALLERLAGSARD
ncbi:MAG: PAS domain-containing protein, partial [Lentisphaeria bacterium]|nr:PAS domain-containing protein [Lentisphaeria bacterium]